MDIAQLVSPSLDILTIKIVRDKQSRKSKGFAFVEMKNDDHAAQVIEALDNAEYRDKVLTVKYATEPVAKPAPRFNKPRPFDQNRTQNRNEGSQPFKPRRPRI